MRAGDAMASSAAVEDPYSSVPDGPFLPSASTPPRPIVLPGLPRNFEFEMPRTSHETVGSQASKVYVDLAYMSSDESEFDFSRAIEGDSPIPMSADQPDSPLEMDSCGSSPLEASGKKKKGKERRQKSKSLMIQRHASMEIAHSTSTSPEEDSKKSHKMHKSSRLTSSKKSNTDLAKTYSGISGSSSTTFVTVCKARRKSFYESMDIETLWRDEFLEREFVLFLRTLYAGEIWECYKEIRIFNERDSTDLATLLLEARNIYLRFFAAQSTMQVSIGWEEREAVTKNLNQCESKVNGFLCTSSLDGECSSPRVRKLSAAQKWTGQRLSSSVGDESAEARVLCNELRAIFQPAVFELESSITNEMIRQFISSRTFEQ